MNPNTELWKAWLGFNLSHSLGVIVFASAVAATVLLAPDAAMTSPVFAAAATGVSIIYVLLSIRFWFIVPAMGSALTAGLFATAFYL